MRGVGRISALESGVRPLAKVTGFDSFWPVSFFGGRRCVHWRYPGEVLFAFEGCNVRIADDTASLCWVRRQ